MNINIGYIVRYLLLVILYIIKGGYEIRVLIYRFLWYNVVICYIVVCIYYNYCFFLRCWEIYLKDR